MMSGFSFENQGTFTYLVYGVSPEETLDTMSLGMLTNNKIPGMAPAIFTQMDTAKFIKYNVSAKVSVKQFFEGQVNKKRLIGVFRGIVDAILSAEDYMIDPNSILLDLDYIFADVSTCETVLVCLPIMEKAANTDITAFFKNIMFSTQFDQTENCDHVAKIINYLNASPVLSLPDFRTLLESLTAAPQAPASPPAPAPAPAPAAATPVSQAASAAPKPVMQTPNVGAAPAAPAKQPQVVQPPAPKKAAKAVEQAAPASGGDEKQISMLTLLMHYSKENKELYDAQKAARKGKKEKEAPKQAAPKEKKGKKAKNGGATFTVPGAPIQSGFAIPGQPTAQPAPQPAPQPQKPVQSVAQPASQPASQPAAQKPVSQPSVAYPVQAPPAPAEGQVASFGETTVLGGGVIGETTVLGATAADVQIKPHLIRLKNNERIALDKPVFRIGKEKSYVDYFIGDNSAISRSHANIISRDGEFFVVDTNSTNHTYVNGGMIQSNVETKIAHGTKIRLANEEFEFKIY